MFKTVQFEIGYYRNKTFSIDKIHSLLTEIGRFTSYPVYSRESRCKKKVKHVVEQNIKTIFRNPRHLYDTIKRRVIIFGAIIVSIIENKETNYSTAS